MTTTTAPSERYRVMLNRRSGRTHLVDLLNNEDFVCEAQSLCADPLWFFDAAHYGWLTDMGMVDDHLLGPQTWGGPCRGCYGWAWSQVLAEASR